MYAYYYHIIITLCHVWEPSWEQFWPKMAVLQYYGLVLQKREVHCQPLIRGILLRHMCSRHSMCTKMLMYCVCTFIFAFQSCKYLCVLNNIVHVLNMKNQFLKVSSVVDIYIYIYIYTLFSSAPYIAMKLPPCDKWLKFHNVHFVLCTYQCFALLPSRTGLGGRKLGIWQLPNINWCIFTWAWVKSPVFPT